MKNLWAPRNVLALLLVFGPPLVFLLWIGKRFPAYLAGLVGVAVLALYIQSWRVKKRDNSRGWRLRCISPNGWAYEEKKEGAWVGIVMTELMDYREPPHVLRIMNATRWSEYPDWTHGRREEILSRIKAELKEPDYVLKEA